MGESDQMLFGVLFIAGGIVLLVLDVMKRLGICAVLGSLFFVALGVGPLLKLYTFDTAVGAMVVLGGAGMLAHAVKARSALAIAAAITYGATGGGILAGLYTTTSAGLALFVVYGCWGLLQAIKMRAAGSIVYHGGVIAMCVGFIGAIYTEHMGWSVPFVIAGSIAWLVGLSRDGWRIPSAADRQPPTDN